MKIANIKHSLLNNLVILFSSSKEELFLSFSFAGKPLHFDLAINTYKIIEITHCGQKINIIIYVFGKRGSRESVTNQHMLMSMRTFQFKSKDFPDVHQGTWLTSVMRISIFLSLHICNRTTQWQNHS